MTEKTPKPVPGFLEPADDSERKILAKMKQDKKLLLSKDEMQIGDTRRYNIYCLQLRLRKLYVIKPCCSRRKTL